MNTDNKNIMGIICLIVILNLFNPSYLLNNSNHSFARILNIEISEASTFKISGTYYPGPLVIDDDGGGDYTWAQAVLQPWCSGAGNWIHPFIVENLTIDGGGTDNCLTIKDSTAHFIVQNCILYNAGPDIYASD